MLVLFVWSFLVHYYIGSVGSEASLAASAAFPIAFIFTLLSLLQHVLSQRLGGS